MTSLPGRLRPLLRPLLVLGIALFLSAAARGATFETLFTDNTGRTPYGKLVQGRDGSFYGTTFYGGASGCGTVFKITADGVLTTLTSFAPLSNGAHPRAGLVQGRDGNFYGTTCYGGANGFGTVFRITAAGELTVLATFDYDNGTHPLGGVVEGADGSFYGTASEGGANGCGTVFKVTGDGKLTTLATFDGNSGYFPSAGLAQGNDGAFYGTTSFGGSKGDAGTVFKVTSAGVLTTLAVFTGGNGRSPLADLVLGADGNFYGTASEGGTSGGGTVFKVTPSGALTALASFTSLKGTYPEAALVQGPDGSLYGVTKEGGANGFGAVFKVTGSGEMTTVVSFAGSNGANPLGGLALTSDGFLFGATSKGAANNFGSVFKVDSTSGAVSALASFATAHGSYPEAGLAEGEDGYFYGTTYSGGPADYGSVYRVTSSGELTTLASFNQTNGMYPSGRLLNGGDGCFYGTTPLGGAQGCGTIFKVTSSGELATLLSFAKASGAYPSSDLATGDDGEFYGTTSGGGAHDFGTVFKASRSGVLTTLVSFDNTNGRNPGAGLVKATDGCFYGTVGGGPNNCGMIFKMTPAGELTMLASFNGLNGSTPYGNLMEGADGALYGTTYLGGANDLGVIFKATKTGELTALVSFNGENGRYPVAGLVQGIDGNFYGTAVYGGASDNGVIYKVTNLGALSVLHSFDGVTASQPWAVPVFGSDGNLYGTAGQMTIWRLVLASAPTAVTGAPGKINSTGATVSGSVNSNWAKASVSFEYGTSDAYGASAPSVPGTVQSTNETPVAADLTGLLPHTLYHYRLKAASGAGAAVGDDATFSTLNTNPTAGSSKVIVASEETVMVALPFSAVDADGDAVAVQSIAASEGAPFTLGSVSGNMIELTRKTDAVGTGVIAFTVSDGFGGTANGAVQVTVRPSAPAAFVLAAEGAPVSGAGQPGSGIPAGATWAGFGAPCATATGDAVFLASLRAGASTIKGVVLQSGATGQTQALAVVGDAVPGLPGLTFSAFKDPVAVSVPDGRRCVAFLASVSGGGVTRGDSRILCRRWIDGAAATFEVLGRTGTAGFAIGAAGVHAAAFTTFGLAADGTLWATANLAQRVAGVSAVDDKALLCWSPKETAARLAVRKGDLLSLSDGKSHAVSSIATLAAVSGSPGQGRWMTPDALGLRISFRDGMRGIFTIGSDGDGLVEAARRSGSIVLRDREGGEIARAASWSSFGLPSVDAGEGMAFAGRLLTGTGGMTRGSVAGVFFQEQGSENWTAAARLGEATDLGDGSTFAGFKDPLSNASGEVAFLARERSESAIRSALWRLPGTRGEASPSRRLVRVAAQGEAAPDAAGGLFASFASVALPDGPAAGLLFVAKLQAGLNGTPGPGGVTSINDAGLWAVDSRGTVRLLLREGSALSGAASGSPLVRNFRVLGAVSGSPGQGRACDAKGEVFSQVDFSDGSSALVKLQTP